MTEKIVPYISTFFFAFSFAKSSTWIMDFYNHIPNFLCIHVYFRLELDVDLYNCLHLFPHFSLHLSLYSPKAEHGFSQSSPHFSLQLSLTSPRYGKIIKVRSRLLLCQLFVFKEPLWQGKLMAPFTRPIKEGCCSFNSILSAHNKRLWIFLGF